MCGNYSSVSCFFCLSQISGFKETFSLWLFYNWFPWRVFSSVWGYTEATNYVY
jgi:hypothetical protein